VRDRRRRDRGRRGPGPPAREARPRRAHARRGSGEGLGHSGLSQPRPQLFLIDDGDAELLGLGEFCGADVGAGDEEVGAGRDRRGDGCAGLLAEALERRARDLLTGAFTDPRSGAKVSRPDVTRLVEQAAATTASSVSSSTDYLLAGENVGASKTTKAEKLGVTVVDQDELWTWLAEAGVA
jgi:hypothetical protein